MVSSIRLVAQTREIPPVDDLLAHTSAGRPLAWLRRGEGIVAAGDGGVILGSGSALPALTVQSSNPAAGVTVASSSNHGGVTPYAVGVAAGATVALEAPDAAPVLGELLGQECLDLLAVRLGLGSVGGVHRLRSYVRPPGAPPPGPPSVPPLRRASRAAAAAPTTRPDHGG